MPIANASGAMPTSPSSARAHTGHDAAVRDRRRRTPTNCHSSPKAMARTAQRMRQRDGARRCRIATRQPALRMQAARAGAQQERRPGPHSRPATDVRPAVSVATAWRSRPAGTPVPARGSRRRRASARRCVAAMLHRPRAAARAAAAAPAATPAAPPAPAPRPAADNPNPAAPRCPARAVATAPAGCASGRSGRSTAGRRWPARSSNL